MSGVTRNDVHDHLKEMAESLTALKGELYARLCLAIFSQSNVVETILDQLQGPDDKKRFFGEAYGTMTSQLCGVILSYEIRRRHPAYDLYEEEEKNRMGIQLGLELASDLEMLRKKQEEFWK